ncbi:MAG: hypothetical protein ACRC8E_05195, partial [Plesiomonas shigelloides]
SLKILIKNNLFIFLDVATGLKHADTSPIVLAQVMLEACHSEFATRHVKKSTSYRRCIPLAALH